jgi:hypothetical protein
MKPKSRDKNWTHAVSTHVFNLNTAKSNVFKNQCCKVCCVVLILRRIKETYYLHNLFTNCVKQIWKIALNTSKYFSSYFSSARFAVLCEYKDPVPGTTKSTGRLRAAHVLPVV